MTHSGEKATQLTDTTPRAQARYWERLRETPPRDRLRRAFALSAQVRGAAMADLRRQLPGAAPRELAVAFLRRVYGEEIASRFAARPQR